LPFLGPAAVVGGALAACAPGSRVGLSSVLVVPVFARDEILEVRRLIERHLEYTSSDRARRVLDDWDESVRRFVKVIPKDYKRMLAAIARAEEQGLAGEEAIMVAFEENARDLARVGGN
jgi:glutamate synthase (ferredoxin)